MRVGQGCWRCLGVCSLTESSCRFWFQSETPSGDIEHPPEMKIVVVIDEVDVAKEPPGRWALSERV